jgi:tetratricopeptide (TPR) repeat protein
MLNLSNIISSRWILVALAAGIIAGHCSAALGQTDSLKVKAIALFEEANYPGAIECLQQALADSPDDADIYYYLGYFTHYLCYDSVPLSGFGRAKSDEILRFLQRAVELDPKHGNARYFIGAEYGARARDEMERGNIEGVIEQFRLGRQSGGYPDWMLEFGRNVLRSCARHAILFAGGDADTNAIQYLQWVEGYRTDVTVIPWASLERPSSVALLKKGVGGIVEPAPISWSDQQIESMHPYKWKKNTIRIPIPEAVGQAYGETQTTVEWELSPDLARGDVLAYLSAGRAVFADIVVTNRWQRPVYFSTGCSPRAWDGLESHVQVCGVAFGLFPFERNSDVDVETTSALLRDENNFQFLPTVRDSDMPRASSMLQNYRTSFLYLAFHHVKEHDIESAKTVFAAMKRFVPKDLVPANEQFEDAIKTLERMLDQSE